MAGNTEKIFSLFVGLMPFFKPQSGIEILMKGVLQKFFLAIVIILFLLSGCARTPSTSSAKHVSTMEIKYLLQGDNKNLYQVTCNNGKQHTIIFNPAEQDFQYYSPNKRDYITYYDVRFKDLIYFARWVCRNN